VNERENKNCKTGRDLTSNRPILNLIKQLRGGKKKDRCMLRVRKLHSFSKKGEGRRREGVERRKGKSREKGTNLVFVLYPQYFFFPKLSESEVSNNSEKARLKTSCL